MQHVAVCVVGDGEEVRRHLGATLALVLLNDALRVDGNASVRVDDDAEQTRVRLQTHRTFTYRVGQEKWGHRLMTIIVPNLNRFEKTIQLKIPG